MDLQRIGIYRKELMGFAALWIFFFHVWEPIFQNSVRFLENIEWYIKRTGYCGVEIFLLLSGMGLVYAINKEDLRSFYFRRWVRIYPSFIIWFTISTVVRSDKMSIVDYLKRITFYANWMEDMFAYKWYVAAILMFYLCFPLYYYVLKHRKHPIGFTVLLICAEFSLVIVFHSYIRTDLEAFIDRIPVFILGVLVGHLCLVRARGNFMQYCLKGWQWGAYAWLVFFALF